MYSAIILTTNNHCYISENEKNKDIVFPYIIHCLSGDITLTPRNTQSYAVKGNNSNEIYFWDKTTDVKGSLNNAKLANRFNRMLKIIKTECEERK